METLCVFPDSRSTKWKKECVTELNISGLYHKHLKIVLSDTCTISVS